MSLSAFTKAKLNLSLNITGKREDNYHLLHSVVAFCEIGDRLEATPAQELSLSVSGRFNTGLSSQDNLVIKAASLLKEYSNVATGAIIHLEKRLPVASGIGGGSGDAALTLQLLNLLWECGLTADELVFLGRQLGADVPVCLHGNICLMEGIGETLTPLPPLPELYAVLINPLIAIPTPWVFRQLMEKDWIDYALCCPEKLADKDFSGCTNALEAVVTRHYPEIENLLTTLRSMDSICYAAMSGSGATCFAITDTIVSAYHIADHLSILFPSHWIQVGKLH